MGCWVVGYILLGRLKGDPSILCSSKEREQSNCYWVWDFVIAENLKSRVGWPNRPKQFAHQGRRDIVDTITHA